MAAEHFGLAGQREAPLPGERTVNTLIEAGDRRYVLKASPDSARAEVELEGAALDHLAAAGVEVVPRLVRTVQGDPLALHAGAGGAALQAVQLLTWVPGRTWASTGPHPRAALRDLGRMVARVDAALATFTHPALARPLPWNLVGAAQARELLPHVADRDRRAAAGAVLDRFAAHTGPRLEQLPAQAIHNDANDANVVVDGDGTVRGLIDFGDVCVAPRICGLAVAAAYAMPAGADPVRAVLPLLAGYHEVAPLRPQELDLLLDLVRARLALSIAMAGWQHGRDPGNDYLVSSQDAVWALLQRLAGVDDRLALCQVREACGYEPDPGARDLRRYLATATPAALLGRPLSELSRWTFDWSAGSGAASWTPDRLFAHLAERGAEVGLGRYLEDRDVYTTDAYAPADGSGARRTVHLGVDVFVPAGTTLHAPLDAVVHAMHDNTAPQDYGPVVILEHRAGDGGRFFTLYGHLSRATLDGLEVGAALAAGQPFARVGEEHENGGWAPHVHLQVLTDLVGRGVDVPGVAARDELAVWESICPDPNLLLGVPEGTRADPGLRRAEILRRRSTSMSAALSLSYAEPLHIVRGEGAYLYDGQARGWLDLVNNVAHVGHCHPRVVAAAVAQQALLNTNTRYLHDAVVSYARRLAGTLPDPLSVVFLVNSGSEANDLALRLAYAHTGSREVVVLDHAYHGNLTSLIDVSPYKFDGPGGAGRPEHTHVVALPDRYRGRLGDGAEPYLADLDRVLAGLAARGSGAAVLLAEAIPGTAGQVVLADGFLSGAYHRVRAAGGVCIADEVQTGFGRVGDAFWAFEQHGVVPDVVTLGKPIGNGHPMGAVVTTPQIAASFATGMEYFNTFGGNPVSARVGLAVLDVLADERLQLHAARVGRRLRDGLAALRERHQSVGDVRGSGLFLGIELVSDRDRRTPATAAAAGVVEAVKRRGVLLSSDGPDHNVLKIKPPMVLAEADADRVVTVLDEALAEQPG